MIRAMTDRIRRARCGSAALAASLLLAGCASGPEISPEEALPLVAGPDRVILVTIDTLRADYVGAYGAEHVKTPTLDALAAEGTRFEHAIAPTPITLPSHASIHTGLDPVQHGVHHNGSYALDPAFATLAEHFEAAGFATAAFVAASVLGTPYGLDQGFQHYDDRLGYRRTAPSGGGVAERRADAVVDSALAWLEDAPDRFFLWVHLYDPHAAYDPPPGYAERPSAPLPSEAEVGFFDSAAASMPGPYAGEIRFADEQLGRFLRAVEQRFSIGGTLVAVTSDHGESLGEHGELTHSMSVYDATQRVPLIFIGTGVPSGRVVSTPVRLVDVAPTLLALAELPPLPGAVGVDLSPWMQGEREDPLEAYVETLATHLDFGWSPVLGLRNERWRYLRKTGPELYDLAADPKETWNLAAEQPEVVAELDARLDTRLANARSPAPSRTPSDDERDQLVALGYVVAEPTREIEPLGWVGGLDPAEGMPTLNATMEARSRLAEGDPAAALEVLEPYEEMGGWVSWARSDIALEQGDPAAAERHARAALAANEELPGGWAALGRALEAQQRDQEAAAAYQRVIELDPAEPAPLAGLPRLAEARGDRADAIARYEKAALRAVPDAEAAVRLAMLYLEDGRPARARELLNESWGAGAVSPELRIEAARAEAGAGYSALALRRLSSAAQGSRDPTPYVEAFEEIRSSYGVPHFP